ncbi:hypothetical protein Tco_0472536 [Tanacetum coccineum]
MPIDETYLGLLVSDVGHSLHFGRPKFALIIGLPFGIVNFGLYTFGELKFRNRVFPHKLGLSVTNLDVIGVIEDEETFRKLCDQDSIRKPFKDILFRSLSHLKDVTVGGLKIQKLYQEHLESTTTTDSMPTIAKYESSWWIRSHLEKSRKRAHSNFRVSSIVCTTNVIGPKKWLKDKVICEPNVRVFKLETIIQVLARERNEEYGVLHFNDEFSSLGREFMDSLNILFQDLIQPHYSDEDISNDFVVEDELRLCLEDEERMLLEQEKNIIEEQRFRVEEAKRMRLEEDKLLQIAELKKRQHEFMNSTHVKNTVWLTPDIERFISQQVHVKCKFPWSDDYTVGQNFWLTLACLDPSRKGWLSEELDACSMSSHELVEWEQQEAGSPYLRIPPLKPRRKGIEFPCKNLFRDFLHCDSVADELVLDDNWQYKGLDVDDVGGSSKHCDLVHENVVYKGHSLLNMDKERFSKIVVLDDVVTDTLAYTLPLVLKKKCRNKVNVTRKTRCLNNSKSMRLRKGCGKRVAIGGHGRGLERFIGLNVDVVDDDPHVTKQVSLPARSFNIECIPGAGDTYLPYNLSRVVAHTSRTADRHHYLPPVVTRSSSCFLD